MVGVAVNGRIHSSDSSQSPVNPTFNLQSTMLCTASRRKEKEKEGKGEVSKGGREGGVGKKGTR